MMKGKFAPSIGVSQRVEPGGAPGSFKVATSNREVIMKPRERYAVAIGPGDLEARPGTTTFATLIQPAHRGAAGEADYWRSVIAKAPPEARLRRHRQLAGEDGRPRRSRCCATDGA